MENIESPLVPEGTIGERMSFIVCRTSQGADVRGTLHRLTRFTSVFEVYNPYSILQLSEVLTSFRILMSERIVYSGRAVIANLVNTGIILICEVSIAEEGWVDVDIFSPIHQKDRLLGEFSDFLKETEKVYRVQPAFKVVVADMQTMLVDMKRWMEQVELGVRSLPTPDRLSAERDILAQLIKPVVPAIMPLINRIEAAAAEIPLDVQPVHKSYIKKQLHPIIMCSPFVYRTYQKPLGYAGDYEMVSMMLRDPYEGSSLFAKILNRLCLEIPPVIAHRNRIDYLCDSLKREVQRNRIAGKPCKIYNLGCGPAQEVQRFLGTGDLADNADFLLLDFNDETVAYTTQVLRETRARHGRSTPVQVVKRSVQQVLKENFRSGGGEGEQYDVVYCAGLFDYLSDRVCKRLLSIFYDKLAPGGLLMATNVHPSNPWRNWMEYLGEWHLVYRTQEEFLRLAPDGAQPRQTSVLADVTGVNIFLEVRKPDNA
jgi:extracellular factor (EF) 3-hydroxypalmitic acid methyl ester biosynthesis protein